MQKIFQLPLGYYAEADGSRRLSDGRRELTTSELSELRSNTATGTKYCSFLDASNEPKFKWGLCTTPHRYLCEYKGKFVGTIY